MPAQKGKDLLLKVDSNGAGSFSTVAGLRARSLSFNATTVDVTDQESTGRWRELLEGAGIKTARVTGSGIFKDAASDETLRQYFFNGTVRDWQVIVPDLGTVEGPFQIGTLEYGGQHDAEVTFDMSREGGKQWSIATGARSKPCSTARAIGSA
jgi:TP901-1 family phage major tail protein